MDINYLLQREQVERMLADRAASHNARAVHAELAQGYRALIDRHRRDVIAAAVSGTSAASPAL